MSNSFLVIFRTSFVSFQFYASLMAGSVKRMILYFLSLIGLIAFLAMWIQLPGLILGITELTDWGVRKLPTLRFQSGQLEAGPQKEYLFSLQEDFPFLGKDFHLVIDPTEPKEFSSIPRGIFFHKNQMVVKDTHMKQNFSYPKDLSLTVSSFTLIHWRDILLWLMPVYLGIRTFLSLILFRGLEVILLGSLAFLGLRLMKKNLTLNVCFLIAVVALGPALILTLLISFFGPSLPYSGLIYYGVYLIYFIGGLKVCLQKIEGGNQKAQIIPPDING